MDPQVQASFIPKKSLDVSAPSGNGFGGLVFLIALLIFIASLVSAVAAFGYTKYLNSAIVTKSHSLALAEGAYDPGTIEDLSRIDSRLMQAKILLGKHVAVSGVFNFLSTQTLANVSFGDFSYTLSDDGSAKISMAGSADSFSSVALQSDQFNGNKLLKEVVFSGVTADTDGKINFAVNATVDPSVISYAASLGQSVAVPAPTNNAPATTTSSSDQTNGAFAPTQ